MPTRTQQRPATSRGRFARPSAAQQRAAGRFARPSAAQQRAAGRLGRPSASPQRASGGLGRLGRPQPSAGRKGRPARRSQKPAGAGKLLSGLMGALPGGGGRRRSRGAAMGKGAGGLAALAGVAGLAFKNRDKIAGRRGDHAHPGDADTMTPAGPAGS